MVLKFVIFLHITCATIWTGGHLILSIGFLPKAKRKNEFSIIEAFKSKFKPIDMSLLVISAITGVYMSVVYTTDFIAFDFTNHHYKNIYIKLILLIFTIALANNAHFFLKLKRNLKPLSYRIILVTLSSVLFVFVEFSTRPESLL